MADTFLVYTVGCHQGRVELSSIIRTDTLYLNEKLKTAWLESKGWVGKDVLS